MDIDLSVLRGLEREKEIPFKELVEIIEAAVLAAYHRHVGNHNKARAVLDQKTGHVQIFATTLDEDGNETGEIEATPMILVELQPMPPNKLSLKDSVS